MRFLDLCKSCCRSHGGFTSVYFLQLVYHKALERCCGWYIKKFVPIDKSVVLFYSKPDYADNARAMAEYMIENGYSKKYKIYFNVCDLSKYKDTVDGITFVSCKDKKGWYKLEKMFLMITAGYMMETHGNLLSIRYRKPDQFRVRLWHGCGYKDRDSSDKVNVRKFDIALVPGRLFVKPKAYFWNVEEKYILPIGYPRYNWLKSKDDGAQKFASLLKINSNTKLIMWMPTFRKDKEGKLNDSANITQFPLITDKSQWIELDRICKEKNLVLLVKLHRLQPDYNIPFENLSNIKRISDDTFEKANVLMYKFLAITDALISDYSSVAVDYLIVDRPIAFALQDYEEYKRMRGFIFDEPRNYMPGHHLYSFNDLKVFLSDISIGLDPYKSKRLQMRDIAISCSNDYCKDILDKIGISKT